MEAAFFIASSFPTRATPVLEQIVALHCSLHTPGICMTALLMIFIVQTTQLRGSIRHFSAALGCRLPNWRSCVKFLQHERATLSQAPAGSYGPWKRKRYEAINKRFGRLIDSYSSGVARKVEFVVFLDQPLTFIKFEFLMSDFRHIDFCRRDLFSIFCNLHLFHEESEWATPKTSCLNCDQVAELSVAVTGVH